jgi:hypothetical protein
MPKLMEKIKGIFKKKPSQAKKEGRPKTEPEQPSAEAKPEGQGQ